MQSACQMLCPLDVARDFAIFTGFYGTYAVAVLVRCKSPIFRVWQFPATQINRETDILEAIFVGQNVTGSSQRLKSHRDIASIRPVATTAPT